MKERLAVTQTDTWRERQTVKEGDGEIQQFSGSWILWIDGSVIEEIGWRIVWDALLCEAHFNLRIIAISVSVSLSYSVTVCLALCLCLSLSLSVAVFVCHSLCLSVPQPLFPSAFVCCYSAIVLRISLSGSVSLSVFLSQSALPLYIWLFSICLAVSDESLCSQ